MCSDILCSLNPAGPGSKLNHEGPGGAFPLSNSVNRKATETKWYQMKCLAGTIIRKTKVLASGQFRRSKVKVKCQGQRSKSAFYSDIDLYILEENAKQNAPLRKNGNTWLKMKENTLGNPMMCR